MNYKTNFESKIDLFLDRMHYVSEEYFWLMMHWKQPWIWIWKTMWQYFFTFLQEYIEECKVNNIDPMDRWQVYKYFDKFTREPNVRSLWYNYWYWSDKINENWEIELTEQDKNKCDFY